MLTPTFMQSPVTMATPFTLGTGSDEEEVYVANTGSNKKVKKIRRTSSIISLASTNSVASSFNNNNAANVTGNANVVNSVSAAVPPNMTPANNIPYTSGIINANGGGGLGLSFPPQQSFGNISSSTAARQGQPVTTGISSLQSTRNRSLSCISNSSTFNGIKNSPLRKPKVKAGNKSEVNTPTGTSVSGSSAGVNSQAHIPSSLISNNSYSTTDHSNKSSFSSSRLSSVSTVPTAQESNKISVTNNFSSNSNNRPTFSSPYVSSKQDSHLETGSISNKRRASDLSQNLEAEDEEDQQSYNMLQSLLFDGTNETSSLFDDFKGDSIKPNYSFNDSGNNNSSGYINNNDTNSEEPDANNKLNNFGFSGSSGNEINRDENFSESTIMNKIADNKVVPVLASSDKNEGGNNTKFFGFNQEITPEGFSGQSEAPMKMFDMEDYTGLGDSFMGNSNSNSNASGENNSNNKNMDNNLNTENALENKDYFATDENWNNHSHFDGGELPQKYKISPEEQQHQLQSNYIDSNFPDSGQDIDIDMNELSVDNTFAALFNESEIMDDLNASQINDNFVNNRYS
ncbi:unnamed protein product [[Candida] boidinii]|nr:unnamed protein product [[Candida] boidinii]